MLKKGIRVAATVAAVALVMSACGSDDPDSDAGGNGGAETPTVDAGLQAFCDAVVGAESALIAAAEGIPSDDPAPLMDTAEENAPGAIAEELGNVLEPARTVVETQDPSPLQTEEFSTNDEAVDEFVGENCESEKVNVTAVDYAYEGLPETVPSGRVSVDLTNNGEELHELVLLRIEEEGVSVEDLLSLPQREAQQMVTLTRSVFAPIGESDVETFALEPGEYAAVCFVPVGTTSLDAPANGAPHALEGMAGQITVE